MATSGSISDAIVPPGPRSRALRAAATGRGRGRGRGRAGVQIPAEVPQLPQLPVRVEYYNTEGQLRFVDIPSPDHVELTLPPGVQQVPREYVEACFRVISGLMVLVRQLYGNEERQRTAIRHQRDAFAMLMAADEEVECEDDEDGYVIDASPPAEGPSRDT